MRTFTYTRASDARAAVAAVARDPDTRFLGGGTNLLDLMKMGLAHVRNRVREPHKHIATGVSPST